jgi:hypothetical protein
VDFLASSLNTSVFQKFGATEQLSTLKSSLLQVLAQLLLQVWDRLNQAANERDLQRFNKDYLHSLNQISLNKVVSFCYSLGLTIHSV